MTGTPVYTAPKRIVLEDTGERRHPKGREMYVWLGAAPDVAWVVTAMGAEQKPMPVVTLGDRLSFADWDDDWSDEPAYYAIYRIAEVQP